MALKFNKSDFHEIKFSLILLNETSGTECRDYGSIKLREVKKEGISLLVPSTSCQKSHSLVILFFPGVHPKIPDRIPPSRQGKGIYFSALGKVDEKTEVENGLSLVKLRFTQFDKHGWDDIVESFNERRKQVNAHIDRLKIKDED